MTYVLIQLLSGALIIYKEKVMYGNWKEKSPS